ncbi:MAG: hypothetical protein LUD79_09145 [Oscillospiraceae bacterium]|nr:hypothetical protein [Oscillospiraceae bacterium]
MDLYSPRPVFPGYDLIAADLPPEVDHLDLEALLLQAGRLSPEELHLIYNSPGMGHTVPEVMKDVSTRRNGG